MLQRACHDILHVFPGCKAEYRWKVGESVATAGAEVTAHYRQSMRAEWAQEEAMTLGISGCFLEIF